MITVSLQQTSASNRTLKPYKLPHGLSIWLIIITVELPDHARTPASDLKAVIPCWVFFPKLFPCHLTLESVVAGDHSHS